MSLPHEVLCYCYGCVMNVHTYTLSCNSVCDVIYPSTIFLLAVYAFICWVTQEALSSTKDTGFRVGQPWFEFWLEHFTALWTVLTNSHVRSFSFFSATKISLPPVFQDSKGTQSMWGHIASPWVIKPPAWDVRRLGTTVCLLRTM